MNKSSLVLFSLLLLASCNESDPSPSENNDPIPPALTTGTTEISGSGVDPLAEFAWHLNNTGQRSFSTTPGIPGNDLKILDANHLGYEGRGIRIAISDTGIETTHPDLSGNQLSDEHRSYASENPANWHDANPFPVEYQGHGTAVTGLIAALAGNGIGSRGVAPGAQYAGFLFLGDFHSSESSYEAKTLDQITGDFDIFNYSYGYAGCSFFPVSTSIINAYKNGVTNLRDGKGAIYIKAAGNEFRGNNSNCHENDNSTFYGNSNTGEDQNLPYVIVTAASNAAGKISSYSTPGSGVWITAAGGEFGTGSPAMITTDITGCSYGLSVSGSTSNTFNQGSLSNNTNCNYTSIMNGTSSAAPTLSGVVALILEANPDLSWRDVKHILMRTADKIQYSNSAIPHPSGTSGALVGHTYDFLYVKNAAGYDYSNTYGFGRANALRAVREAQIYSFPLSPYLETSWTSSGQINLSIPDRSSVGITHLQNMPSNYFIESVQIKLNTDHTYIGDLGVELLSPSGTRSKILLVNSNINHSGLADYTLLSNAFYGEVSKGNWTIKLIDGANQDIGKLLSWSLKINGHAL